MGQLENQTQALLRRDPSVFFQLLTSLSVPVNRVKEIKDENISINWQYVKEVGESFESVNVVPDRVRN